MGNCLHATRLIVCVLGCAEAQRGAQAAGFGPLQEGLVLTCSSALVRQLLASPPPPVRTTSSCHHHVTWAFGNTGGTHTPSTLVL